MIRLLLRLFPRHFRDTYGQDMRDVFNDQLAAARRIGGWRAVFALWIRTVTRMVAAAWGEHRAAARSSSHRLGLGPLESLRTDLRLTGRSLARTPMFALITVSVIAIGIGAVATIYSAMNALVLRPLPGTTNGDQLFGVDRRSEDMSEGVSASVAFYRHLHGTTQAFDDVAVWSRVSLSIVMSDQRLAVSGSVVSPNYFGVLGLRPAAGRLFSPNESRSSVVISHRLWTRYFAGARDVIGRSLSLNGRPYTVVGVAPQGFRGVFTPLRLDAWVPLDAQAHVRPGVTSEHIPWLWMFGRLRAGVSPDQARTELTARTRAWTTSGLGDPYSRYAFIRLTPLTGLPDDARQAIFGFGGVLMGAAVLVLLVAGANVSSLLATRADARRHEMALRAAMGAGRWRLVQQLLTETLILFLAGAAGGLLLAWLGTSALEQLPLPGDTALMLELSPDARVVLVALGLALTAGLLFGLGPGLKGTSHSPSNLLRSSTAGSGRRRGRLTRVLIVGQLAASLVLLTTTALFVRALARGATIDPGFSRENVTFMSFNTESFGYDADRSQTFYATLSARARDMGGAADLAFGQAGPLLAQASGGAVTIEGSSAAERMAVMHTMVGPRYFATLRIPLIEGREFEARDQPGAPQVAVVSEAFARRAWPGRPGVAGLRFRLGERLVTVVGVAREVKFGDLDDPETPFVYLSLTQHPMPNQILFVRSRPGAPRIDAALTAAVSGIDPAIPVPAVLSLAQEAGVAVLPQRVAAMVTSTLGVGALLLACAGLYGVMAYAAAARTREVGVRMALGASRSDVVRLFLADGVKLTAVSLVLGLIGAAGAASLVSSYLLGMAPFDVMAFSSAAVLLSVVAAIATLVPARRAAAADPARSLRDLRSS